ncbi:histidine kinase [Ectothiorhodospira haloalkaliphila]|uniref:histidine kinase n=1 Tax=Ectothiorhodospira haloalkaliphila TaxID=421628 RepID=W8KGH2_9GAMM|nr:MULTISPECIES: sensor histidine kinase [Ectothiorhodospira]AHK78899.1 histidine kinase [Ectothiorhodospira haloalkaliphila]MCG5493126.1 ATP-binding protein [Ectothiorhodospira variabilis]MCG5502455.1 ATP-binding protein [Ectothiorhodospira variabilis]MCG5505779.1 ATP-binding protein [Ectothiorhodospira variabilis]
MISEIGVLYAVGVAYLALLFFIAHATERGWLPSALVRHPMVYVLSLGVYATTWTYYGSVGFAQSEGYNYLTIYLGVTLAFMLAPLLLAPILRLVRDYQLTSLADLFAFRYRSQWTGLLVTLFMLAGILPYIALQIKAVTDSVSVLTQEAPPHLLALGFCATLGLFAILFGARHITPREKHEGLVVAIAFESAVKLVALLMVGAFALFGIFGGWSGLNTWLMEHPEALEALYEPVSEGPWFTLMLLAFAAAFLLPRQFHMLFVENMDPRALRVATWGLPLFLLLLNLPIPLILWAGQAAALETPADYFALALPVDGGASWLALFTFIGGVSAASAMMIITTLALAAMCLNHLILPAHVNQQSLPQSNLYGWLLWGRRLLILLIIAMGYGFYWLLEFNQGLVQVGLISFVAVAQFLPGYLALLFWPRATRIGFIAGLLGGIAVWILALIIPVIHESGLPMIDFNLAVVMGAEDENRWAFATFWSLALNSLLFVIGSLLTRPTREETEAAQACRREQLSPAGVTSDARNVAQLESHLAQVIGPQTAGLEIQRALQDLGMQPSEKRPGELRRLRTRLERNLSGLMGPLLARMIVDNQLNVAPQAQVALADSLRFVEEQLEHSTVRLRGLAAELDTLRRYHRQVLHELPLGVCSIDPGGDILIWNNTMAMISGIDAGHAVGQPLSALKDPWEGVLRTFISGDDKHLYKLQISVEGRYRWLNLHKAAIESPAVDRSAAHGLGGMVVLVEDLTELHNLESEVAHNDRLASIGRLAAGVAHEIGNPLTGITSLAQNLRYEQDPAEVDLTVKQILEQTRRINDIVQSLITFSHAGEAPRPLPVTVNLRDCVEEALQLIKLSDVGREVTCVNEVPNDLKARGNHQRLLQVFVNLVNNALQASIPGDRVAIRGTRLPGGVEIHVDDEGAGIPSGLLDQIFEPFFTTKPPGEGTGLGLSVVYSIIQDHGGLVYADSRAQGGTRFSIRLPAIEEEETMA